MALFKILRGESINLVDTPVTDGFAYFTPKDGKFYIDYGTSGDEPIFGRSSTPNSEQLVPNRICINDTLEMHNRDKHSDINQSLLTSDTVQFAKMGLGTATPNETLDVVGNVRIRQENSMKFGGVGASDSAFEIKYNATTKSLDFNCLLEK